jgi:hypothetical protein
MKPLRWDMQLGLASQLDYTAIQSGKTKSPSNKGDSWMQVTTSASSQGAGRIFFS